MEYHNSSYGYKTTGMKDIEEILFVRISLSLTIIYSPSFHPWTSWCLNFHDVWQPISLFMIMEIVECHEKEGEWWEKDPTAPRVSDGTRMMMVKVDGENDEEAWNLLLLLIFVLSFTVLFLLVHLLLSTFSLLQSPSSDRSSLVVPAWNFQVQF